ncbi:DUF2946 family protein [Castellaniella sp.]|uniref:DUF2946 family protein n=1 Tax=Castellaniella sp. TaxID=1955812 RepID=UPI003C76E2BD
MMVAGALYSIRMKPFASRWSLHAPSLPWVWTLCLALVLRALVPAGTMLDLGARDGFLPGLVLCPVQNPGMSMEGHPHSDDRPQSHASPLCLLAQHAGGSPLPTAVSALAWGLMTAFVLAASRAAAPPVRHERGAPLGSRAPPLSLI